MPIRLADLTTGTGAEALTSDERNYIREILGISEITTDSRYTESETRFDSFTPYSNKSARYWINLYDSKGDGTIDINLTEGVSVSKVRDRQRIALALFNLVFASGNTTPIEDINIPKYAEKRSKVTMVSVNFTEDAGTSSEY